MIVMIIVIVNIILIICYYFFATIIIIIIIIMPTYASLKHQSLYESQAIEGEISRILRQSIMYQRHPSDFACNMSVGLNIVKSHFSVTCG